MNVRKKLELSQREAGRIFGGGDNAFYWYEAGKSQHHPSYGEIAKTSRSPP
ncbi:MAG: type II toxin-antitoxin system MqsA family antitoxin [Symbiopectobacterium sp.]